MLSLLILAAMTYHLVAYERGQDQSGTDFAITLSGIFYLGWIGAYLISLRDLPDGIWWVLLVLPAVWIADSGAYFIGRSFGKHKLSPRLSPKKTWEGYIGGVVTGTLGAGLLAYLWTLARRAGTAITRLERADRWLHHLPDHHPGRPGRKHDQAPGGHQGFLQPDPGAWRRLRPDRFLAVGGGAWVLL